MCEWHIQGLCDHLTRGALASPPQRSALKKSHPAHSYSLDHTPFLTSELDQRRGWKPETICVFSCSPLSRVMGTGVSEGAAAATPFATSVSSNHRYLLDQAGDPFMIVGDSAHSMSVDLSPTQMAAYFADRRAHGFNSVLVQLICGVYTGNHNKNSANYATYDGITPFTTNGDISTPNPAYFNRMQTMARLAEKDGITLLDPADTGQLVKSSQFLAHNGVTKDYNYGRFLGRHFQGLPEHRVGERQ